MDRIFKYINYNNILLSTILTTFSIAVINPQLTHASKSNILPDVNFAVKIKKLIDKALEYKDKLDADSLLDTVLEIKEQIESHTGKKFDLDKEIDRIESEIKKKGRKVSKNNIQNFRKIVNSKIKKQKNQTFIFRSYLKGEINFEEYEVLCIKNDGYQNDPSPKVPLRSYIGITLMLGGGFLMAASPFFPPIALTGEVMIGIGFGFVADDCLELCDEKK